MSKPAIAAYIHEPLDVHGQLFPQIALDSAFRVDSLRDVRDLLLCELFHSDLGSDTYFLQDGSRSHATDAEDVSQSDVDSLLPR